jgi:hypothetical protein
MIPGIPGNLSLQSTDQTSQTSQTKSTGALGGSGQRSSIINMFSQGGSRLDSAISDGTGMPLWGWIAIGGAALLLVWWVWRKRK